MKRICALLAVLLLLGGCKPAADELISVGTEDGGGSGYGVSVKSVLKLSDFYFITRGSTRDNNTLVLGTPVYTMGESDTYHLEDGSQVVLTYDAKGILEDTMYTSAEDNKNYGLFDIFVQQGVLHNSGSSTDTQNGGNNEGQQPSTDGGAEQTPTDRPIFSTDTFRKEAFDGGLNLYLDRSTVLATFGSPSAFMGRSYRKDSYIIDVYKLSDGSTLMLDYGYDRKSLRAAAIRDTGGILSGYLGSWAEQSKPADFVRPTVSLNQVTSLKKGISPQKVYEKLGEPAWFEGSSSNYKDAYVLQDGNTVYLSYNTERTQLQEAYQQSSDGKVLEVALG